MADVQIAILMAEWGEYAPTAGGTRWSKELVRQVFQERNGWSIGSWWDACSLEHLKPQFNIFDLGTFPERQESLNREQLIAKIVALARDKGFPVDTFTRHVVFMHPSPNPSGAHNGNAVLDVTASHEYYAHEIGHVMGLHHPWGYDSDGIGREYESQFCIMGSFARDFQLQAPALSSPQDLTTIGTALWTYGVMPSAATLYRDVGTFKTSDRVQTITPGTNGTFDLAALSESHLPYPLLYRIPAGPDQYFLVEYRIPTHWDRAIGTPTVVVHSVGVQNQVGGYSRPWFVHAIQAPFQDAWWYHNPSIGIEVQARSTNDLSVLLKVTSPAAVKSATLHEHPTRLETGTQTLDQGTVRLNRDSDPGLCHEELRSYDVNIDGFAEAVRLDLTTDAFTNAVIDEWQVNDRVVTPGQVFTLPVASTYTRVGGRPPVLPHLVKNSSSSVQLHLDTRADGATLRSTLGGSAFTVRVEALVRDAAEDPAMPAARRVASLDVSFVGERIVWSEAYKDAVEACWLARLRRHTPPSRSRIKIAPPAPPWLPRADPQIIRRVEDRLAGRGVRIPSRDE